MTKSTPRISFCAQMDDVENLALLLSAFHESGYRHVNQSDVIRFCVGSFADAVRADSARRSAAPGASK